MNILLETKKEIKQFDEKHMTSPDDVFNLVEKVILDTENNIYGTPQDIALKKIKLGLLKRFREVVKNSVLFDYTGSGWCYWISITCYGIELYMGHCCYMNIENGNIVGEGYDGAYSILSVDSTLMSLDEYSKVVGVKAATLRQWIRRGKLRTAKKYGDEWRVPEYTPVPGYGYESATYFVKDDAHVCFPETFEYLSDADVISVFQDTDNKQLFHISDHKTNQIYDISSDEREELEVFMQLNPDIKYKSPITELYRRI